MAKKVQVTITDKDGDVVTTFYTKKLTKVVNKLPAGTPLNVYIQENNFGKQFVGNYVTKSPPNEPETPPPVECPDGQHEENGKCVPDVIPEPDHECPDHQHWDDAAQKCVPDEVEPPTCPAGQHLENGVCVPDVIVPPPPTTGSLWNSNTDGKWNDGRKRTITTKQNGQQPNDKSIFVAASGSPKLEIDGDGVAHLVSGSGGVDNLSLKLLSRHQEGGECSNRGGGEGFSINHSGWDCKREKCHNIHSSIGSGSLPKNVQDNKWHKAKFSLKHEGSGIKLKGAIDYMDGAGFKEVMSKTDSSPDAWFMDKALNMKNSYIWIRLNNSDHGRIYIMVLNWDSELTLDFMFEPARNAIALRNVDLVAI